MKRFSEVVSSCDGTVGKGGDRHDKERWIPGRGIGNPLGHRHPGPDVIASVMMHCGACVPGGGGMHQPGPPCVGFLIHPSRSREN